MRHSRNIHACPECNLCFDYGANTHCNEDGERTRYGDQSCKFRHYPGCRRIELYPDERARLYAYHDQSMNRHWSDVLDKYGITKRHRFRAQDAVAYHFDHGTLWVKERA